MQIRRRLAAKLYRWARAAGRVRGVDRGGEHEHGAGLMQSRQTDGNDQQQG